MIHSPASTPTVSVVSISYNQESFIRDTLDGFVSQEVDFPIEIVIADDASTDATPSIIRSYAERHPQLFRPILRTTNVGAHANLTEALSAARGEFIALCEGDDYWTDPRKLSKQVAFLRKNPGLGVCFHPVRVTWSDRSAEDSEFPPLDWRRDFSVDTLIRRNFIQTNSAMYRRLPRYDDIPPDVMPLDWYLHVRHALHGGSAMLPDTMGVYRRHPQGMWFDAENNRERFWSKHGRGFAALVDAMFVLCDGHRERRASLLAFARWVLGQMATVPGTEGRTQVLETVARYPQLFAGNITQRAFVVLAVRYQQIQTARRQMVSLARRRHVVQSERADR
ncbi:MAG: hypothetical protein QOJ95_5908 [Mycobacterium sp.]|nr:hypothetical protein [Mycobacterium sp.]